MHRTTLRGATAALAFCVMASAIAFAQNEAAPKRERYKMDQPVAEAVYKAKIQNLMHDPKEGEPEDAGLISLAQYKGKKVVLLYFASEHCPYTRAYDSRVGQMLKEIEKKDVVTLGVRCTANDTAEGIRKWVESKNLAISLLNDDKGILARYFRVERTPTFVVIDKKGIVRFWGAFDDDPENVAGSKRFVPKAITASLSGKPAGVKTAPPFG
jgi:peroxiredoxin